ncbi:insulin-like growth factor 2 mRNA-binding protein 2 isoform X2 [Crassostrea angulata]|uniref:insulin-like growth factor 2 mRNA-binding protein 2 isoform X2 n=1 Tax=Magallana angulata TaxID=2784310 RepID=UPI0022B0A6C9|nr:insulin-like growth factor 2 mRNA-binding protein 2 isoform X2 [Crassostrea angulata]
MAEGGEDMPEIKVEEVEETTTMYRVYVGNLDQAVDEGTLRGLFEEHGIAIGTILKKKNYAFIDCADQNNVERAINQLNDYNLLGSVMQVEASTSRRRKSNKIAIQNLPVHIKRDEVEALVSGLGNLVRCEQGPEGLVYVTFETQEQAQQAVSSLHGLEYQGVGLKVEIAGGMGPGGGNKPRRGGPRINNQNQGMNRQELPLRILVGSEYVGAIIGKQGQTIHNITSESRARVDIHRRDGLSTDTLVTIKGSPENCSKACKEIMKIVESEAQSLNKGEPPLKIICPNSLCGRIIGKQGNVIKSFMEQTGTHIVVSSATDMNNFFVDRMITITGSPENTSKAEALVSEKMRKCFEQDAQNYNTQMGMFGGMPPMPNMMPPYNFQRGPPYPPYQMQGDGFYYGQGGPPQQDLEVTYLYIPESTVGACIGSKGSNIKEIMRLSGARIKIENPQMQSGKNGDMNGDRKGPTPPLEERKVIITGTAEAQWKAQFYVFDKIKTEGGFQRIEEVHLRSEVLVPRSMIGRIIGKGGQNVREMQRVSGAIVKVPDQNSQTQSDGDMEVAVSIIGHFYAMQPAIRRIRSLVNPRPQQGPVLMPGQQRRLQPRTQQNGK